MNSADIAAASWSIAGFCDFVAMKDPRIPILARIWILARSEKSIATGLVATIFRVLVAGITGDGVASISVTWFRLCAYYMVSARFAFSDASESDQGLTVAGNPQVLWILYDNLE